MKIFLLVVSFAVAVAGCAALSKFQDKGSDYAAKGIKEYCDNTDAEFRAKFRAEVNAKAFPNSAQIECAAAESGS